MTKRPLTIGEVVLRSAEYLRGKGIESARLDAELLLCQILNTDRLHLYMDWQKPLTDLEISAYREFIRRRGQEREPVGRIIGHRAFYGRDFVLSPATFEPRPETEGVVERALSLLEKEPALNSEAATIFEVGTGTGCIIVSIAAESDETHRFLASDVSAEALETAKQNAHRHGVDRRIDFRHGEYFRGFDGSLSLVVSNPPYIATGEIPSLPPEVRTFDPRAALDGGQDGLDVVRVLARESAPRLTHGGWCVLELGEGQADDAVEVFRQVEKFSDIHVDKDLAGKDRYLLARRS